MHLSLPMMHLSDALKAQGCLGSASSMRSGRAVALTGYRLWATVVINPVTIKLKQNQKNVHRNFHGSDGNGTQLESGGWGKGIRRWKRVNIFTVGTHTHTHTSLFETGERNQVFNQPEVLTINIFSFYDFLIFSAFCTFFKMSQVLTVQLAAN